jgi:methylenetetrahydrofolate dehydrogenase (NADP+)/methenyltetrahydrofolate cyclohydrolase
MYFLPIKSKADIVVAATGCRHLVKGDWIKPGTIILDVGINDGIPGKDKKNLVGDVEFEEALKNAKLITPVPGGIGPMTVSMLMRNVFYQWQNFYLNT